MHDNPYLPGIFSANEQEIGGRLGKNHGIVLVKPMPQPVSPTKSAVAFFIFSFANT